MDDLLGTTFLLVIGSAAVMVGCSPEGRDAPERASTVEVDVPTDDGDAMDDPGPGSVTGADGEPLEVSEQAILPGQSRIRALNGRYWRATGNIHCNSPKIQLVPNRKTCEKARPRFGWIFEEVGSHARIRSALCANKCVTFPAPLNEPVGLEDCGLSPSQLLSHFPAPEEDGRICALSGLCVTHRGNKLYATTLWSAPDWYREDC